VRIRIRSLLAAIEAREESAGEPSAPAQPA